MTRVIIVWTEKGRRWKGCTAMFPLSMQCGTILLQKTTTGCNVSTSSVELLTFCRRPPQGAPASGEISQLYETAYVAVGQGWCSCKGKKMKLYREQHTTRVTIICVYQKQIWTGIGVAGDFKLGRQ